MEELKKLKNCRGKVQQLFLMLVWSEFGDTLKIDDCTDMEGNAYSIFFEYKGLVFNLIYSNIYHMDISEQGNMVKEAFLSSPQLFIKYINMCIQQDNFRTELNDVFGIDIY